MRVSFIKYEKKDYQIPKLLGMNIEEKKNQKKLIIK